MGLHAQRVARHGAYRGLGVQLLLAWRVQAYVKVLGRTGTGQVAMRVTVCVVRICVSRTTCSYSYLCHVCVESASSYVYLLLCIWSPIWSRVATFGYLSYLELLLHVR